MAGRSAGDGEDAGRVATVEAVDGREGACLLLVFSSSTLDLDGVMRGVTDAAPGVEAIGCSTAGEIVTGGPGDQSVVVFAFGGDGFEAATEVATNASASLRDAGARAAGCLGSLREERPHRVLIMLTDGLAGDQQEIVRGAYSVAGAGVPMVGGCAGDDMRMSVTHQFHGRDVHRDAVVAAALGSDAPIGIGVRHGWRRVGDPMLVTESSGNNVFAIDDRPALDVYLERLQAPSPARGDPQEFVRFAATHPLGLASRQGEEQVRFISGADFDRRSLVSIAEVPRGGMAWLMEGDDKSVLEATDAACQDALDPLDGPPIGMVAFDCIARRGVLGEAGIRSEIARVTSLGDGAPVAGFYTYGEIARTKGISGFHNQTLVVLAVS